jgi:predicted Holliday junction resolvase-like endonuclease
VANNLPILIVSAFAAGLLAALLWVWKRYADLEQTLADLRADHAIEIRKARAQSIRLSRSTLLGNAAEQIAPIAPAFCAKFSPSDARFIGAPIDYVIFDGLAAGRLERVVFVEIKSGASSALNSNERAVREAIQEGRVAFELLSLAQSPGGRVVRPEQGGVDAAPIGIDVAGLGRGQTEDEP